MIFLLICSDEKGWHTFEQGNFIYHVSIQEANYLNNDNIHIRKGAKNTLPKEVEAGCFSGCSKKVKAKAKKEAECISIISFVANIGSLVASVVAVFF